MGCYLLIHMKHSITCEQCFVVSFFSWSGLEGEGTVNRFCRLLLYSCHKFYHKFHCYIINLNINQILILLLSLIFLLFSLNNCRLELTTQISTSGSIQHKNTGLTLGLRPANERRRYFVTTSLIGWTQALNHPWKYMSIGMLSNCKLN